MKRFYREFNTSKCEGVEEICVVHGEDVTITASLKDDEGKVPFKGSVKAFYSKISDLQEANVEIPLYEAECAIIGGDAHVSWSGKDNDDGSVGYRLWIRSENEGVISYPCVFELVMEESPGRNPTAIVPVPKDEYYTKAEIDEKLARLASLNGGQA